MRTAELDAIADVLTDFVHPRGEVVSASRVDEFLAALKEHGLAIVPLSAPTIRPGDADHPAEQVRAAGR